MLFRRSTVLGFVALLLSAHLGADEVESGYKYGKILAQDLLSASTSQVGSVKASDYFTGDNFNSDQAREKMNSGDIPKTEVSSFINSIEHKANKNRFVIDENEALFESSEKIIQSPYESIGHTLVEEGVEYILEKCNKSGNPAVVEAVRTLHVKVEHTPGEVNITKVCKGHYFDHHYRHLGSAVREYNTLYHKLENNSELKRWGCIRDGKTLKADWLHKDNIKECDLFVEKSSVVRQESFSQAEKWIWEGVSQEEASSEFFFLIGHDCIEGESTKKLNGLDVHRKCWKDRMVFTVTPKSINTCLNLKSKGCSLVNSKCTKGTSENCQLWEHTFKCYSRGSRNRQGINEGSIFGLDGREDIPKQESNTSFAQATATLAVFEEVEQELKQEGEDARKVMLFRPQLRKCEKSVVGELAYDCCGSLKGVTNALYLTKCNAEEKALGEMKANGLCHYIGKRPKKVMGIKTATVHVYASFSSKLARILQEQAREQLGIGWGTAENPNLSALSPEDIAKLDLSKMDFSELFEEQFERAGTDIQNRLRNAKFRTDDIKRSMQESRRRDNV